LPLLAADTGFTFGDGWGIALLFLGVAVFAAIGALSHQHERAFSASLIYLGLGTLAAAIITGFDVRWVNPVQDTALFEHVAELAVIIALFTAGLKVERALRWREWSSVARLLAIAMPLTIAMVAVFGATVMGLSLGAAIVLGAALAPTDPVLAGDIGIGPPGEEDEHEPPFAITAEAGLNDGLAFPFVLLGLVVLDDDIGGGEWLVADVLWPIAGGVAIGAGVGAAVAWSIKRLRDRELLIPALDGWVAVAGVLAVYGLAEVASTYGFLAAFAGGVAFRRYERDHEVNHGVHNGAEVVEKFGELAAILLLGSSLTLAGLGVPGIEGWLLALALIFVFRPLAANVALVGSRMERPGERAFVAWFGVRGIGTLFYVATASAAGSPLPADERAVVVWTAIVCVVLSIVLHGVTAGPLQRWMNAHVLTPPPAREPATARAR
jgi:NhaP-type Na+/H+ or K+/H+ antiporter